MGRKIPLEKRIEEAFQTYKPTIDLASQFLGPEHECSPTCITLPVVSCYIQNLAHFSDILDSTLRFSSQLRHIPCLILSLENFANPHQWAAKSQTL
jgi:hypothetical protein